MADTRGRRQDRQGGQRLAGGRGATGSRGGLSFRVGKREIGHLHGDHAAHFGLPKALFHHLHDRGQVDFHPVFPRQARLRRRAGSTPRATSRT